MELQNLFAFLNFSFRSKFFRLLQSQDAFFSLSVREGFGCLFDSGIFGGCVVSGGVLFFTVWLSCCLVALGLLRVSGTVLIRGVPGELWVLFAWLLLLVLLNKMGC